MSNVTKKFELGNVVVWRVDEPDVNNPRSRYPEIDFRPGDRVKVTAGGCAQTGGTGKTWKRYLDPSGPNSDRLYHGTIKIPGMPAFARIQQVVNQEIVVPDNASGDLSLQLGYEDDDYSDNGYWGHDDGTEDQCKNSSNAWVEIFIVHK